jgi:hypothetical protein
MILICLSCGVELQPVLADTGSLRCQDCRASRQPLRTDLAERQRLAYSARLRLIPKTALTSRVAA